MFSDAGCYNPLENSFTIVTEASQCWRIRGLIGAGTFNTIRYARLTCWARFVQADVQASRLAWSTFPTAGSSLSPSLLAQLAAADEKVCGGAFLRRRLNACSAAISNGRESCRDRPSRNHRPSRRRERRRLRSPQ